MHGTFVITKDRERKKEDKGERKQRIGGATQLALKMEGRVVVQACMVLEAQAAGQ